MYKPTFGFQAQNKFKNNKKVFIEEQQGFGISRLMMTSKIQLDSFLANTLWKRPHKHYGFQKKKRRQLVLGVQTTKFWHLTPSFMKKQELVLKHIYLSTMNIYLINNLYKNQVICWELKGKWIETKLCTPKSLWISNFDMSFQKFNQHVQ